MNINLFIRGHQGSPPSEFTVLPLRGWLAAPGLVSRCGAG